MLVLSICCVHLCCFCVSVVMVMQAPCWLDVEDGSSVDGCASSVFMHCCALIGSQVCDVITLVCCHIT